MLARFTFSVWRGLTPLQALQHHGTGRQITLVLPPARSSSSLVTPWFVGRCLEASLLLPSRGMNEPVYESKGTLTVWIDRCWDGAKCELAEDQQVLLHVWRRR